MYQCGGARHKMGRSLSRLGGSFLVVGAVRSPDQVFMGGRTGTLLRLGRFFRALCTALIFVTIHHLLKRRAVIQVHLLKGLVDPLEDAAELVRLHMLLNNRQDSAELLIFLLQTQLLVHVCDSLFKTRLES